MVEEATTPTPPSEKEATTPSGEKEQLLQKKPQETPTAPESEEKTKVAKLESEVDTLTKKLEQQKTLQSQADRRARTEKIARIKLERTLKKIREEGTIPPEFEELETPPEREEKLKAKIMIQDLIMSNSDYLELLNRDITLKEVIKNNPFALLTEWLDAEDATAQIQEKLDNRLTSLVQPKKEEKEEKEKEIEAGAIQPPESVPPKIPTPSEKALKEGDIEKSIKSKIKFRGLEE